MGRIIRAMGMYFSQNVVTMRVHRDLAGVRETKICLPTLSNHACAICTYIPMENLQVCMCDTCDT